MEEQKNKTKRKTRNKTTCFLRIKEAITYFFLN